MGDAIVAAALAEGQEVQIDPLAGAIVLVETSGVKRGVFPSCDNAELCPLAKRIAAPKKCSDPNERRVRELRRKCLVKCVDFLCKYEEHAQNVWSMIETDMIAPLNLKGDELSFKEAPKTLRQVDRKCKAQRLVTNSDGKLPMTVLASMDKNDENLIDDLVCMFVKMTVTETLPSECKEKAFLGEMLTLRMQEIGGETIGAWVDRAVKTDTKSVQWSEGAAYKLTFANGRAIKCKRRSGLEGEIPDYMCIRADFEVNNPCSDMQARAVKGASSTALCLLFPKDSAPFQHVLDKKGKALKALRERAAKSLAEKKAAAGQGVALDTSALTDHATMRRAAALQRARTALGDNPQKRQRVFKLDAA